MNLKRSLLLGTTILTTSLVLTGACNSPLGSKVFVNGICYGVNLSASGFDPNNPYGTGYQLVFDSEFNDMNDIDKSCPSPPSSAGCTNPPGHNWYLNTWTFPNTATNPSTDLAIETPPYTSGKTTVLHIKQSQVNGNWGLSTMGTSTGASNGPAPWQQNWNGKVFTGGWFVEARFSTEWQSCTGPGGPGPSCVATGTVVTAPNADNGHASIWSYSSDHFSVSATRFAENDLMDGVYGTGFYLQNVLDWQGSTGTSVTSGHGVGCMDVNNLINITCGGFPNNFTDRTNVHTYAQLWVPATATAQGYVQNFFDGVSMGKVVWNQYTGKPPVGADIASIIDTNHMQVNIGNDPRHAEDSVAATSTSWWDWVHIWQQQGAATTSGNPIISPQANFSGGNGSCITH